MQNSTGGKITPPATVTAAAPNLPATGLAVNKISIGGLLIDTTVPYSGLYISSISLKQLVAGSPNTASPIPYTANLRIEGSKTKPGTKLAVGGGMLTKDIPISVTLQTPASGGTAVLTSCQTLGGATGGSGGGGGGGDKLTVLTNPITVATLNNTGFNQAGLVLPSTSIHQWVKIPLSGLVPTSATIAKMFVYGSQAVVFVSGKGQPRPAFSGTFTTFAQSNFNLMAFQSSNNAPNGNTMDVVIDDTRSFYVLVAPTQSTYQSVYVLRGYTEPAS